MKFERIRHNRFLVLGRAGLDLYADPPGTSIEHAHHFEAALGGSAANIATGIVKLGGTASLITAVSDDAVGRFTINQLQRYGIGTQYVHVVGGEARNSLAVVESRAENCQSVIYRNGATDFQISVDDAQSVAFVDFGALIVTGTALALEPSRSATFYAMERAREGDRPVVFDVDYRPYSWANAGEAAAICLRAAALSDIIIGNDVEFAVMAGGGDGLALARNLARSSAEMTVYKRGEKGCVTFTGGQSFETGIYQVTALKPTGAGDAFMAGFVTGLAEGLELSMSVKRGAAAAAIVVTRVGCAPAMPTQDDVEKFIATHADPTAIVR